MRNFWLTVLEGMTVLLLCSVLYADVPAEWAYSQDIRVEAKGIVRFQIPLETLAAHSDALVKLRVMDSAGQEIPYLIQEGWWESRQFTENVVTAQSTRMDDGKTTMTGRIAADVPEIVEFDRIRLQSGSERFLKPFTLEGSIDGVRWSPLLTRVPLYKEAGFSETNTLAFPAGRWRFVRLTLDDSQSSPIPIGRVTLLSARKGPETLLALTPKMVSTEHVTGQSLVTLELPSGLLMLESLCVETPQPTFLRHVQIEQEIFSNSKYEKNILGQGTIHRLTQGGRLSESICVDMDRQVQSSRFFLRVMHGDNPPLTLTGIKARVYPVFLSFDAPGSGSYTLLAGNPTAPLREYDLSALKEPLSRGPFQKAVVGTLTPNPVFQKPDTFAQVDEQGIEIDVMAWPARKKVLLQKPGLQRLELDLETLSHQVSLPASLRLVRQGRQIPYIVSQGSVIRELTPVLSAPVQDGKKTRWTLTLPYAALPISELGFLVKESLFQRNVSVWEEIPDERGEPVKRSLGYASWVMTHPSPGRRFIIPISNPQSKSLILETDNGDNPPINLSQETARYSAPHILFKASPGEDIYLYYGFPEAPAPTYDIALLASQLMNTPPHTAALTIEEKLKTSPWWDVPVPTGAMRIVFWVVMGLVVLGLLFVIVKLLPAESEKPS